MQITNQCNKDSNLLSQDTTDIAEGEGDTDIMDWDGSIWPEENGSPDENGSVVISIKQKYM